MLREMSLKSVRTSIGSVAQETSRSPAGNESVFPRVDALFADAMDAFPGSAWLHLFIAQYVNVYRGNRHIEMLHLGAAEVCIRHACNVTPPVISLTAQSLSPMADVLFLLHQRRAVIRQQDDAAAVGAMSVSSRMRFEKLRIRADNLTLKARQEQVWPW